jgi:hypothetical protein
LFSEWVNYRKAEQYFNKGEQRFGTEDSGWQFKEQNVEKR